MFDLITSYSVLADAMKGWDRQIDASAFRDGLEIARSGLGALQCIFITRVQQVIGEEQDLGRRASRLSGILIGSEALSMLTSGFFGVKEPVFIVGETTLAGLYAEAVRFFGRTAATIELDEVLHRRRLVAPGGFPRRLACQSASKRDPLSAWKKDPS